MLWIGLAAALLLLIAGCGTTPAGQSAGAGAPSASQSQTGTNAAAKPPTADSREGAGASGTGTLNGSAPNPSSASDSPAQPAPYHDPLTGMGTDKPVDQRPVMIMVENQADARPQSGLNGADMVYEVLAEGGITRFAAIFQSASPAIVGPVRSIRPYFVTIGEGYDALVAHAGGSPEGLAVLDQSKLPNFDEIYNAGADFWRDNSRRMPHNLYTSVDKIREAAKKRGVSGKWRNPNYPFLAANAKVTGKPAANVTIHYLTNYRVEYAYDPASGLYLRSMDGAPHVDRETGKQLTARNIIVCRAGFKVLDKKGRLAMNLDGSGPGYLFRQGTEQTITWKGVNGAIHAYKDGKEVPLLPGQTWVQVIPTNSGVSYQ